MTAQVFIASYPPDFVWLAPCLKSLRHYSRGFIPPAICVDSADADEAQRLVAATYPEASVVVKDGRPGAGFMRAQCAMMRADQFCPDADVIFFVGSDCLAVGEMTPVMYCDGDRPLVLMAGYDEMLKFHPATIPWRDGVERVLGFRPDHEYMRRLPSVFPRSIFEPFRNQVERLHRAAFDDVIHTLNTQARNISEANLLGAFAHRFMPDSCRFVDVAGQGLYNAPIDGFPNSLLQMWSWGGMDTPADSLFEIDGKPVRGRLPREIIATELAKIQ